MAIKDWKKIGKQSKKVLNYKGFKITIIKLTSKNSAYIIEGEKPVYQTFVGTQWIGNYKSQLTAFNQSKKFINKNPNLKIQRGYN